MLFVKKKTIHEPLIFLFQDAEVVGEHSSPFWCFDDLSPRSWMDIPVIQIVLVV